MSSPAVYSPLEVDPTLVRWSAGAPGRGWSPLPPEHQGPLTPEDLYLLRLAFDLTPEAGSFLAVLEDHEVQRQYAEKESLARLPCPLGFRLGPEGPQRDAPGGLLVRPVRFGQLVEMASFANRGEQGLALGVFVVPGPEAMALLVEGLARPDEADVSPHTLAWGGLETAGPARRAGFWLVPGSLPASRLQAHVAGAGAALEADARELAAGDARTARRLVARLLA